MDELNAFLGVVLNYLKPKQKNIILNIQNDLFDIGADLATPLNKKNNSIRLRKNQTIYLEKEIDKINSELETINLIYTSRRK